MSLNYNGYGSWAMGEAAYDSVTDLMRPEVESIIFHTMFLGMPEITEANAEEFYRRAELLYWSKGIAEPFFSLDDVKGMVGLKTNASALTLKQFADKTIKDWVKRVNAK